MRAIEGQTLYDPATGLWASTGNLNALRAYPAATLLLSGRVLVAQKSFQRAAQRDEAAIAAWYADRWPALQEKPRRKDTLLSG